MARQTSKKDSKKNKFHFNGLIFWLIFVAIILIWFLLVKGKIADNIQETDFFNTSFGEEPEFITKFVQKNATNPEPAKETEDPVIQLKLPEEVEVKESELVERPEIIKKNEKKKTDKKQTEPMLEEKTNQKIPVTEIPKPVPVVKPMKLNLCYVLIDAGGSVIRKEVVKEVPRNDSPLTTAINTLLSGPDVDDVQKGYISLIPEGTKLLSARVSNRTATLNFNEAFSFNKYGVQGYLGQLMQIVYTATSFSTIDNVQFLIEGQNLEYLGGEGVWIGSPLSRISFK